MKIFQKFSNLFVSLGFSRELSFAQEGDEKMRGRRSPKQVDTTCALILHRRLCWNGPVLILQLQNISRTEVSRFMSFILVAAIKRGKVHE